MSVEQLCEQNQEHRYEIVELREKLEKYEDTNKKLKLLARWNLRSTKSALKDVEEMLRVLDEHD